MTGWQKNIVRCTGYLAAGLIILAALLVCIARLLTPVLNEHRHDMEVWASRMLSRPVQVQYVHLSWRGYTPKLIFEQVKIVNPNTNQPVLSIPQITLYINFFRSLLHWQVALNSLKVTGVHLTIQQHAEGQFSIPGIMEANVTDNTTGQSINFDSALAWIFTQPYLILENVDINYSKDKQPPKLVTIYSLILKNFASEHWLFGRAVLNQAIPTDIRMELRWAGDMKDLSSIIGHGYFYLRGLSLPQWFANQSWQGLQIKQGLGSAKIWIDWSDKAVHGIQSLFQFYDLQIFANKSKKTSSISRMSGEIDWANHKNYQTLSGKNILLDLPNHLWPTTSFDLKFSLDTVSQPVIESCQISYLDMNDSLAFASRSGLLSQSLEKDLAHWQPQGILRDVEVNNIAKQNDLTQLTMSGRFYQVTFQPGEQFAGVTNAAGKFNWDGKQGDLKLDSKQIVIQFPKLFRQSLAFDELKGQVHFQQNEHNKMINMQEMTVSNREMNAVINLNAMIPMQGSTELDLTANFNLQNAGHITRYLPLNYFNKKLNAWLDNAFSSGTITSGKAILRGKLDDFPFAKNPEKFSISGNLTNVNINYATDWPMLQHADGVLTFSGSGMTFDVTSGSILTIPLLTVHGVIPSLSAEIPTLFVQGKLKSDLSDGMRFIKQSPLAKILGTDLSMLKPHGPMDFLLNLTIPLTGTEKVKVAGDIVMVNAILQLPTWNINLDKLNGTLHFTENGLTAESLQANLFNYPVTMNIKTLSSVITILINGTLNIVDLEKEMDFPLTKFMTGKTQYHNLIEVTTSASSPKTKMTLQTELVGVAVDLPNGLAKTPVEKKPLQFIMLNDDSPLLKAKLMYSNLLSIAIGFDRSKPGMQIVNGNLHLGSGDAAWPTEPGWVLTGEVSLLDLDSLKDNFAKYFQTKHSTEKAPSLLDMNQLRHIDLFAKELRVFGLSFNAMRIALTKNANSNILNLVSREMDGEIIFSHGANQIPAANFKYLYLTKKDKAARAKKDIDPSAIPAFEFSGDDVRFDDLRLGHVALEVAPNASGLTIKTLNLDSPVSSLEATGSWQRIGRSYQSSLQGDLTTSNLNQLLNTWGLGSTSLVAGVANARFNFQWPGAPYQVSTSQLSGSLSVRLNKGRVTNLGDSTDEKIGLGRVLNLFSLQSIPRRLSLDFSDLSEKGYSFDWMKGNFVFNKGNAYTKDMAFDGPIARVDISGRIGLAAKDYDIRMSVTPYLTSSLPLVAALVAANPLAGAAALVADTALRQQVSKLTVYRYSVTGSWDNPSWRQVQ